MLLLLSQGGEGRGGAGGVRRTARPPFPPLTARRHGISAPRPSAVAAPPRRRAGAVPSPRPLARQPVDTDDGKRGLLLEEEELPTGDPGRAPVTHTRRTTSPFLPGRR